MVSTVSPTIYLDPLGLSISLVAVQLDVLTLFESEAHPLTATLEPMLGTKGHSSLGEVNIASPIQKNAIGIFRMIYKPPRLLPRSIRHCNSSQQLLACQRRIPMRFVVRPTTLKEFSSATRQNKAPETVIQYVQV